jgi:hypothetical protein
MLNKCVKPEAVIQNSTTKPPEIDQNGTILDKVDLFVKADVKTTEGRRKPSPTADETICWSETLLLFVDCSSLLQDPSDKIASIAARSFVASGVPALSQTDPFLAESLGGFLGIGKQGFVRFLNLLLSSSDDTFGKITIEGELTGMREASDAWNLGTVCFIMDECRAITPCRGRFIWDG